jgi:hypothetical protein
MRALLNFCVVLALLLAVPDVVRLAAEDNQRPASDAAQVPVAADPAGTPSLSPPPPSSLGAPFQATTNPAAVLPPTSTPVTLLAEDNAGTGAFVAPVKRSKPVIPVAVIPDEEAVPLPVRKPGAKTSEPVAAKAKTTADKKPVKKARVSGAQSKTKKQ